jgi:hypothetical protein
VEPTATAGLGGQATRPAHGSAEVSAGALREVLELGLQDELRSRRVLPRPISDIERARLGPDDYALPRTFARSRTSYELAGPQFGRNASAWTVARPVPSALMVTSASDVSFAVWRSKAILSPCGE